MFYPFVITTKECECGMIIRDAEQAVESVHLLTLINLGYLSRVVWRPPLQLKGLHSLQVSFCQWATLVGDQAL